MTKKRKILLGTLIPLSICVVGTAVIVPLVLKQCNNDGYITFTTQQECEDYLKAHVQVHDERGDWSDRTEENKTAANAYFWDRQNYTIQNMANGFVAYWSGYLTYKDTLKIKVTNKMVDFSMDFLTLWSARYVVIFQDDGNIYFKIWSRMSDANVSSYECVADSIQTVTKGGTIVYNTTTGSHADAFFYNRDYPYIELPITWE